MPKAVIEEFKNIYREIYSIELSDDEAAFRAGNLINLYRAVLIDGQNDYATRNKRIYPEIEGRDTSS
jgi:hypothetical protein